MIAKYRRKVENMQLLELYLTIGLVLCSLKALQCDAISKENYKCCPRAEWESTMHLCEATEFQSYGLLEYVNGTIHFAYSVPLQKTYFGMQVFANSTYLPHPMSINITYLYDYEKGILYEVTTIDNNCTKDKIPFNKTEQCIPADATLVSRGILGDDKQSIVSTYRFIIPAVGFEYYALATVHETDEEQICDPIHVVYSTDVEADTGGFMYSFDIFDLKPLTSTDIFKVPKECL